MNIFIYITIFSQLYIYWRVSNELSIQNNQQTRVLIIMAPFAPNLLLREQMVPCIRTQRSSGSPCLCPSRELTAGPINPLNHS